MTATDELRRLLDERGVEWTYADGTVSFANNGHWCHAWAYSDNAMCVSMGYFTPEQAIAATLGSGTCEYCKDGKFDEQTWMMSNHGWQRINHCPNCGAKVVDA